MVHMGYLGLAVKAWMCRWDVVVYVGVHSNAMVYQCIYVINI